MGKEGKKEGRTKGRNRGRGEEKERNDRKTLISRAAVDWLRTVDLPEC